MTPAQLADIHSACFKTPKPWDQQAFETFLSDPQVALFSAPGSFILTRSAADEMEILTAAVHPDFRRQGTALALLSQVVQAAMRENHTSIFLEVAADNNPAISLYQKSGFQKVGMRPKYYRPTDAAPIDAIVMSRSVNLSTV